MVRTVWIASYPKSGNTWFRLFLANLLHPERAPIPLNDRVMHTPIASSREVFEQQLGVSTAFLRPDEQLRLRPHADMAMAERWPDPRLFRKVHDAYMRDDGGNPLLGQHPHFSAVYLLRNPCDVAVSAAHHWNCTVDEAADRLCRSGFTLAGKKDGLANQLPQRLLSWEGHVRSWLEAPMAVHLLRYESMLASPLPTFRGAVRFLGLDHGDKSIADALDACRFDRLRQQEEELRFRETPRHAARFFRRGTVGEGATLLSPERRSALDAMAGRVEQALERARIHP